MARGIFNTTTRQYFPIYNTDPDDPRAAQTHTKLSHTVPSLHLRSDDANGGSWASSFGFGDLGITFRSLDIPDNSAGAAGAGNLNPSDGSIAAGARHDIADLVCATTEVHWMPGLLALLPPLLTVTVAIWIKQVYLRWLSS